MQKPGWVAGLVVSSSSTDFIVSRLSSFLRFLGVYVVDRVGERFCHAYLEV
jgi:hypothetical protein